MRFVLKRRIPKPRSVRDRSLKRKYGGRKSRAKKQNNKSASRARRASSPLDIPSGMFRLLLLDFLAFCFMHPAQALLNSTPQFIARDRGAVAQGAPLGPGDLGMVA